MLFPIKDYNPTKRTAYITIFLIVLNIGIFFYQRFFSEKGFEAHIASYSMIPKEITHLKNYDIPIKRDYWGHTYYNHRTTPPFLSLVFSLFMHGSLMHLLGNMLFLWIFGNNIEDYLGRFKFLIFYLACGIGASLVHVAFNWHSLVPVIGASGAVSGIMGAYLILYPKARIRTLVFIFILITFIDIPAFIFLIVWFAFQFINMGVGGIAWLAHVGGFLIGLLLIKIKGKKSPAMEIMK